MIPRRGPPSPLSPHGHPPHRPHVWISQPRYRIYDMEKAMSRKSARHIDSQRYIYRCNDLSPFPFFFPPAPRPHATSRTRRRWSPQETTSGRTISPFPHLASHKQTLTSRVRFSSSIPSAPLRVHATRIISTGYVSTRTLPTIYPRRTPGFPPRPTDSFPPPPVFTRLSPTSLSLSLSSLFSLLSSIFPHSLHGPTTHDTPLTVRF